MSNDFESPIAVERSISAGDKSAVYKFAEPSAAELESLFDLTEADGTVSRERAKGLRFRVIAAVVSRSDGSPITVEEAGKMRNVVVNALHKEALDVIGFGADPDEAGND
jgi:hypothetical protein